MPNWVMNVVKFESKADFKKFYNGCEKSHLYFYEHLEYELECNVDFRYDDYCLRDDKHLFHITTAWEDIKKTVVDLSKLFPNGKLTLYYADEDKGNNLGIIVCKNGEVISEETDRSTKLSKAKMNKILLETWGWFG